MLFFNCANERPFPVAPDDLDCFSCNFNQNQALAVSLITSFQNKVSMTPVLIPRVRTGFVTPPRRLIQQTEHRLTRRAFSSLPFQSHLRHYWRLRENAPLVG